MSVPHAGVGDSAISFETLDALELSLKRLRQFGGQFYSPNKKAQSGSSFWFTTSKNTEPRNVKKNSDAAVEQYQSSIRLFRLVHKALTNMARSLDLEMRKMESRMQSIVLSHGISKIPDETLAQILCSVYEPWNTVDRGFLHRPDELRLVCKRFRHVVDAQPFLRCYFTSVMSGEEVARRLEHSGTVGLKIHLDDSLPDFAGFVDAVISQVDRWQEVHFNYNGFNDPTIKRAYSKLKGLDLPRLERFVLRNPWASKRSAHSIYSRWATPSLVDIACHGETPFKLQHMKNIVKCELEDDGFCEDIPAYLHHLSKFLSSSTSLTSLRLTVRDVVLDDIYLESVKGIELPNLRVLEVSFKFLTFDPDEDESNTVDAYGDILFRFITLLKTPRLERVAVTVDNDEAWEDATSEFLVDLLREQGNNKSLQRFEFTQKEPRLKVGDYEGDGIFSNLKVDGFAVFTGLDFVDRATVPYLPTKLSKQGPRLLRRLHLRDCSLSINVLRDLLELLTNGKIYPNFEALVLTRCAGFKKDALRGLVGSEYVSFEDE